MRGAKLDRVLGRLEETFGKMRAPRRASAYEMLVRANCGYPASEEACERGWQALARDVGTEPDDILGATLTKLAKAMRAGGIVPEVRAKRLRQVAARAEAGADLRDRRTLETFPTIGRPGADKILLFTRVEPVAAVPSNALQVPVRIGLGPEHRSYAATYRAVQRSLESALPRTCDARIRAHLLLKRHGQEVCKRSRPRCEICPLTRECDYFSRS